MSDPKRETAADWIWPRVSVESFLPVPRWRNSDLASREAIPDDLIGATIIRFGMAGEGPSVEGGGLVIDYLPNGAAAPKRLVLAFTELGMWVEWIGDSAPPSPSQP